MAWSLW